jgi:lipid-A-disaccharide synthase
MADILDRVLCIFPFEPKVFADVDLDVRYCGHPMVEETLGVEADEGWGTGRKLALVPGSRVQEIQRLFLPMLETAARLGEVEIRVPVANTECRVEMERILSEHPELPQPQLVQGQMRALVKGADAALVTSGTATLEAALLGVPMLILYKTSALTYAVGKWVVKVPFIGMVNLVAEKEVCPEFIQDAADPVAMAAALEPLFADTPQRSEMLEGLQLVRAALASDEGGMKVVDGFMDLF